MGNLVGMFVGAWLHPWKTMEAIRAEGYADAPAGGGLWANIKKYALFIVAMGLISGLITSIMGTIMPPPQATGNKGLIWLMVVIIPLFSFLGSFLGALIVAALVDGLLSFKVQQYGLSYKLIAVLAAFSPVSALVAGIPVAVGGATVGQILSIGLNLWATAVMVGGIIIVRRTPVVRTVVVCGLLFLFLLLLSIFARVASQRQLAGNANLGGGFSDNAGFGGDDLDRQLENLSSQPAAQPTPVAK